MKNPIINNYRELDIGVIGQEEPHCFNCDNSYTCEHDDCEEGQLACSLTGWHVRCGNVCDKYSRATFETSISR
ncbi:MAG: hypothetical protein ACFFC7_16150 [Candidatus Hermodarchaeota archaeon]